MHLWWFKVSGSKYFNCNVALTEILKIIKRHLFKAAFKLPMYKILEPVLLLHVVLDCDFG